MKVKAARPASGGGSFHEKVMRQAQKAPRLNLDCAQPEGELDARIMALSGARSDRIDNGDGRIINLNLKASE